MNWEKKISEEDFFVLLVVTNFFCILFILCFYLYGKTYINDMGFGYANSDTQAITVLTAIILVVVGFFMTLFGAFIMMGCSVICARVKRGIWIIPSILFTLSGYGTIFVGLYTFQYFGVMVTLLSLLVYQVIIFFLVLSKPSIVISKYFLPCALGLTLILVVCFDRLLFGDIGRFRALQVQWFDYMLMLHFVVAYFFSWRSSFNERSFSCLATMEAMMKTFLFTLIGPLLVLGLIFD